MKLIIGLGNPGKQYARTRHNIGFMCLEAYAHEHNLKFKYEKKFIGEIAKTTNAILLKPHTYMNLSGNSVGKVVNYYNIDPDDILIIYDDLDLPTAKVRLRYKGSAGGHKGLLSVLPALGTDAIKRVKFGIDNPPGAEAKYHVLSPFSKAEGDDVIESMNKVKSIIHDFINDTDFLDIMNNYN